MSDMAMKLFGRKVLRFSLDSVNKSALVPNAKCRYICKRYLHAQKLKQNPEAKMYMKAWQIHQYGDNSELTFSDTVRVPRICSPKDVLVEVNAASLNYLDVRMRGGYGRSLLNAMRKRSTPDGTTSEFPLVLGRDFSGVVIETGQQVKDFKPGDEVWGAQFGHKQGSLAEYIVASSKALSRKPLSLSHTEASSIPYVACTVWSALCAVGELSEKKALNQRVLIHAGSGGVGSFAIQLMKAWGAEVTTTCSTDAVDFVTRLGADHVIDYKTQDVYKELMDVAGFDVVLDTVGKYEYSLDAMKSWRNAKYVTILSPALRNSDDLGFLPGLLKTGVAAGMNTFKGFSKGGRSYRWAFFSPNGKALAKVARMVDSGQIQPVIDTIFPFEEVPNAFMKLEDGHARGKMVINAK